MIVGSGSVITDVIPLGGGANVADPNPFLAPASKEHMSLPPDGEFVRGSKKGPALYIAGFAALIGFFSVDFLMREDPAGFIFPTIGSLVGGLIYRIRSRKWPIDPGAKYKQLIYTLLILGLTILPAILLNFMGPGPGLSLMTGVVGIGIICGIFLSGTKRHRHLDNGLPNHDRGIPNE